MQALYRAKKIQKSCSTTIKNLLAVVKRAAQNAIRNPTLSLAHQTGCALEIISG
jgi:hypothetical protein